jgi:hypothetical protein
MKEPNFSAVDFSCRVSGVPVTDLAGMYERVRGEVPIESLKASWLIYGQGFAQSGLRTFIKRTFDLLVSAALLYVLLGDMTEGLTLSVFVLAVLVLGFYQEGQSEAAIEALRLLTQQVEGGRVQGLQPQTMLDRLDVEGEGPGVGHVAVMVAVGHQSGEMQSQRPAGSGQRVLHVGGVGARLHPHPLLHPGVGQRVGPDRRRAFQVEALQVAVALGRDPGIGRVGLVGPLVGVELVAPVVIVGSLVQLGQQRHDGLLVAEPPQCLGRCPSDIRIVMFETMNNGLRCASVVAIA